MKAENVKEFHILVVDDDPSIQALMQKALSDLHYSVDCAATGREAIRLVSSKPKSYAVVVLDYHLPDHNGGIVSREIQRLNPETFVLAFSGDDSRTTLKESMASGASDFVEKGQDTEELIQKIETFYTRYAKNVSGVKKAKSQSANEKLLGSLGLAGTSNEMAEVARKINQHRDHRYTVLLLGESGTGKEKVARALHTGAPDKFFAVNCATYGENTSLMESELFGYEKGAFTGADKLKQGIFEKASGGTLFLDEVHHLSLHAQSKLLRVLQEKSIRRVGGAKEIPIETRIIAGAKPTLKTKSSRGEFLVDLYNRLYIFPVSIAPLRDRKDDILPLVQYFCQKYNNELKKTVEFSRAAIEEMEAHNWPGNVRELENTVLRLIAGCEGKLVSPTDFLNEQATESIIEDGPVNSWSEFKGQMDARERAFIKGALNRNGQSLRKTAKSLDVSFSTLQQRAFKVGLTMGVKSEKKENQRGAHWG